MLKRVLLAIDGSPGAMAASRWVGELAQGIKGLEVTIFHVYLVPEVYTAGGIDAAVIPDLLPELPSAGERRKAARPVLDAARKALGEAPARVRTRVAAFHDAAAAIVRFARSGGYDLIVLGQRGLSPVARLVMNSVSDRVLQQAGCPVVVVRAVPQDDGAAEPGRAADRQRETARV